MERVNEREGRKAVRKRRQTEERGSWRGGGYKGENGMEQDGLNFHNNIPFKFPRSKFSTLFFQLSLFKIK